MKAYEDFSQEHMHHLDAPNGDKVCVDIFRALGKVTEFSWYALREPVVGHKSLTEKP